MSKRRVALVALACIALLVFWVFSPEQEILREVHFNPAASSIDVDSEQGVELSWAYQVANVGSEDVFVRIAGVERSTESGWKFVRDLIFARRFLELTEVNAGETEGLYYKVSTKFDAPIRLHFVVFMEASLRACLKKRTSVDLERGGARFKERGRSISLLYVTDERRRRSRRPAQRH